MTSKPFPLKTLKSFRRFGWRQGADRDDCNGWFSWSKFKVFNANLIFQKRYLSKEHFGSFIPNRCLLTWRFGGSLVSLSFAIPTVRIVLSPQVGIFIYLPKFNFTFRDEGFYLANCQTNLLIVPHDLSLLSYNFTFKHKSTNHLSRWEH